MKLKFVKACEQLDFTGSYIKNKLFEVTKKFKKFQFQQNYKYNSIKMLKF